MKFVVHSPLVRLGYLNKQYVACMTRWDMTYRMPTLILRAKCIQWSCNAPGWFHSSQTLVTSSDQEPGKQYIGQFNGIISEPCLCTFLLDIITLLDSNTKFVVHGDLCTINVRVVDSIQ